MHMDTRRLMTPKIFGHNFLSRSCIKVTPGELYYAAYNMILTQKRLSSAFIKC